MNIKSAINYAKTNKKALAKKALLGVGALIGLIVVSEVLRQKEPLEVIELDYNVDEYIVDAPETEETPESMEAE